MSVATRSSGISCSMPVSPKPTRVNNAYERLKQDILNSELPPGFQAPEPEIAERLGMSRTPVREALIRLEADGLVDLVPRRGARVKGMSRQDMQDIYDILCVLEPLALRRLCFEDQQLDEGLLAPLRDTVAAMHQAELDEDIDAWADAELDFRRLIVGLGTNRRLSILLEALFDQLHRGRLVLLRLMGKPPLMAEVCRDILSAVEARDAELAETLMRRCREEARDRMDEVFFVSRLPHV
ncbi:GntR family transcriptional regulator [Roseibium aestuarii]|uniref:GntR family transcriptional regulator n=1 Tax=Roseibium aestuarii TaxID=2600299 RepID=A0ABW4JUH4_9HYPH|nr:GntR family transcriptional regulator [Roseibium aestuarii]